MRQKTLTFHDTIKRFAAPAFCTYFTTESIAILLVGASLHNSPQELFACDARHALLSLIFIRLTAV